MAERRMLSKKITDHDNFTSLSATAQALYMHLVMAADDDGLCSQTNIAMSKAKAKKKDLEALVEQRYLISFDSGVYAIKHWGMMNRIRKERYHKTDFPDELSQLIVKPNGAYTLTKRGEMSDMRTPSGGEMSDNLPPDGRQSAAEYRLGKVSNYSNSSNARAREEENPPNDLGRVMSFFYDKINPNPSGFATDMLKGYTEDLGADVVLHALGIAQDERKTNWRYIQGILQSYMRDGLTDLAAVLKAEQEYAEKGVRNGGRRRNPGKPENGADAVSQYDIQYDVE